MSNLTRGHTTSCGCAKKDFLESCKIDVVGKKYGYLTVIKELSSGRNGRRVQCLCKCGNVHICNVTDLTTGHTMSCSCMKKSKGELYIEKVLKSMNVCFVRQKRFKDCKNIRTLPFDFYLPDYNTCIEYDGAQHYKSVKYWGGDKKYYSNSQMMK